jgi:hypothetical protein
VAGEGFRSCIQCNRAGGASRPGSTDLVGIAGWAFVFGLPGEAEDYFDPFGPVCCCKTGMLKLLGYLLFASAAVTFYLHIRQDPHAIVPVYKHWTEATPSEERSSEIIIANQHGTTLAERWQARPSPAPGSR